ncbi:hypothetical protein KI387_017347 [Taxus chinensis]|uniref:RNase H type-1 domain-containing protein n=1 Tax=Taxus chinensis TaxID=29808 RepID=A0AA38GJL0_TAXCH|nr:hypothetical protein KI387_017347 [Taxus chinensis]
MKPDMSVEGGCTIRIVVSPVGHMLGSCMRDYLSMVVRHTNIDLSSIGYFCTEHQKNPFAHQPWDTGSLRFKYLVGGAQQSAWEDFQANRKVLWIIGLCHYPLSPDLGTVNEQFAVICKAYPPALITRCFAFYPSDSQVSVCLISSIKENSKLFKVKIKKACSSKEEEVLKQFAFSPPQASFPSIIIKWSKPERGRVKLNFDGASKGNPGLARGGGIIRDHDGDWILAYAGPLGIQSNNVAEARALLWGVNLAREKGIKNILIEGGSLLITNAISKANSQNWALVEYREKNSVTMGGDRTRVESSSHGSIVDNKSIWHLFSIGGFRNYITRLQGHDPLLTMEFGVAWKDGKVVVRGMEIETSEEAIARITSMDMDGLKKFKDKNKHEYEIKTFFRGQGNSSFLH